jgi:hypothetical protein
MFDVSAELTTFYNEHVRLGKSRRDELAGFRDTNLQRLKDGLDALGEEKGEQYPHFFDWKNQGSYAMHTLNQAEEYDYDIDVAVIFKKEDLPEDAAEARTRVQDALRKKTSGFTKAPEARKNAVTIWYSEGYHIDFAVYRERENLWDGKVLEHAGADGWTKRNPDDVNNWFIGQVDNRSPEGRLLNTLLGAPITVEPKQLRRIVRLVKAFAKSRSGWSLPGGMILSALVCEVYKPHSTRDDIALYETLRALQARLAEQKSVFSPVNSSVELTNTPERAKEIERLSKNLDRLLSKLDVLWSAECSKVQALAAWNHIFNQKFWSTSISEATAVRGAQRDDLVLECGIAPRERGPVFSTYKSNSKALPKGVGLRFTIKSTSVPPPYQLKWTVQNEGDEATDANQLTWTKMTTSDSPEMWTSTTYKGNQTMKCELYKDGALRACATHGVRIAGRW